MSALVFCATPGTVRSIETAAPLTEAAVGDLIKVVSRGHRSASAWHER